jgi:hypothetical protein
MAPIVGFAPRAFIRSPRADPITNGRTPSSLSPKTDASASAAVAQRIDQHGEGWRGLTAARVV